jgi:hypothetical protein
MNQDLTKVLRKKAESGIEKSPLFFNNIRREVDNAYYKQG